jgi:type I restriction-modification system DNA methylase subunit
MGAPDTIKRLVDTFQRNVDVYKNDSINETQLRREFLDPFFTALGWDVENKAGYADAYKDVIHEYSLKTKDVREAPDYCFRIGGTRKFFVEAKKPSVNVKDDIHPAFQLRSYAWSAKLPLSVLTDFEEFAVYDCRIPPNKKDKASNARIMFLTYDQYIDKWDEIENIFAHESILRGSFDKYVESNKKKKGTAEVDLVFLDQMEVWRKALAKNIALRNPQLSIRELNYSVQKTIDRIIFLRICEDRGIEDYGQLMSLQNGASVYERLKQIFYRADEKYNSGLFHFENERDRIEPPDNLTLDLSVDDKTIKDIVKELYYPESPYEFSVLPSDILGQVYEQFLGKVIRLTAGHQAVIEDKPEVKKAGGVYYTPTYIVDYIVNNTVGKLISPLSQRGDTGGFQNPKQQSTLKILDPACGSGSFLLGAYQYLLDWHLKYYLKELETSNKLLQQKQPPIYINDRGVYLLTTREKKRILLNNIYGVDIDSQAVEVTKLSLMLKVLEGESTQTLNNELQFFRERALPDLSNNIKCGNSLIGPDFYNQTEMNFLDDEEKLRINVFDWQKEFPQVFKTTSPSIPLLAKEREEKGELDNAGGFDVVIGNPPWGANFNEASKSYLSKKYFSFFGNFDSYLFFIERGLGFLKIKGLISFITPDTWIRTPQFIKLRKLILDKTTVSEIVTLPSKVFKNVSANCIIFNNSKEESINEINVQTRINILNSDSNLVKLSLNNFDKTYEVNSLKWGKSEDLQFQIFQDNSVFELLAKIKSFSVRAEEYLDIMQGIVPYSKESHSNEVIKNRGFHSKEKIDESYGIWIKGRTINRYVIDLSEHEYLKYGKWLHRPRLPKYFSGSRILIQEITGGNPPRISATFSDLTLYHDPGIISCLNRTNIDILFLLGLLNSTLINWYHLYSSPKGSRKTFPKVLIGDIRNFPFPNLTKIDKEKHLVSNLISSVKTIVQLKAKTNFVKTPTERTAIERQIQATDAQIDELVYQLYGLTEEEIKIIEQSER